MEQDEELIDIEGDFELNLRSSSSDPGISVYDINELPSKSANLQPEYVHHPWVLEQGWSLDPCMDEKSKATIEKMLQEEQQYINGRSSSGKKRTHSKSSVKPATLPPTHKQPWNESEKSMFEAGLQMFGRRWAKISELIPTRTTLQVKNYGQQFFKVQKRHRMRGHLPATQSQSSSRSSILDAMRREHPPEAFDSVEKILAAMSTGQPTVQAMPKKEPSIAYYEPQTKQTLTTELKGRQSPLFSYADSVSHGDTIQNGLGSMVPYGKTSISPIRNGADVEVKSTQKQIKVNMSESTLVSLPTVLNTGPMVKLEPVSSQIEQHGSGHEDQLFVEFEDGDQRHLLDGVEDDGEKHLLNGVESEFVSHVKLTSGSEMTHYTIQNGLFVPKSNLLSQPIFEGETFGHAEPGDPLIFSDKGTEDMVVGNTVEIEISHDLMQEHDIDDEINTVDEIDNEVEINNLNVINNVDELHSESMDNKVHAMEYMAIHNDDIGDERENSLQDSEDLFEQANIEINGDDCDDNELMESEESDVDIDIESDSDNEFMTKCKTSANEIYQKLIQEAAISPAELSSQQQTETITGKVEKRTSNFSRENLNKFSGNGGEEIEVSAHLTDDQEEQNSENSRKNSEGRKKSESVDGDSVSQISECSNSSGITLPQFGVMNSHGEFVAMAAPNRPIILERDKVTDEEKEIHFEFFDGRSQKTLERYLKIRNYILDAWEKSKPKYLYKTMVRSGLKNCGDVNCIGRIHTYLEQKGAINYGCEQTNYCRIPRILPSCHARSDKMLLNTQVAHFERMETMRPRKRRVKDQFGHWIPETELEGKTIDHEENSIEITKVKSKPKQIKNAKLKNGQFKLANGDVSLDPFQLIPCRTFSEGNPAPFSVEITSSSLVVMDVHAHVSKAEVIGLLGGRFSDDTLQVLCAEPCHSLSTGMQCEMDPVSQTQASESITEAGMKVVGWYHSHPTFEPNPSLRDIETQEEFQSWFGKGGHHFVGIIVNPYKTKQGLPTSDIRCLTVVQDFDNLLSGLKTPYQFDYSLCPGLSMSKLQVLSRLSTLVKDVSKCKNRVDMFSSIAGTDISFLRKLESSLLKHMWLDEEECASDVMQCIRNLFTQYWNSGNISTDIEQTECISDDAVLDNFV